MVFCCGTDVWHAACGCWMMCMLDDAVLDELTYFPYFTNFYLLTLFTYLLLYLLLCLLLCLLIAYMYTRVLFPRWRLVTGPTPMRPVNVLSVSVPHTQTQSCPPSPLRALARSLSSATVMAMRSSPVLDIHQQQQQQQQQPQSQPQAYPPLNLTVSQHQHQHQQQQDSLAGRSVPLDTQPYTSAPPTRKQNTACDPCRSASHSSPVPRSSLTPILSLPSLKESQGSLQSYPRFRQGTVLRYPSTFLLIHHRYSLALPGLL